MQFQVQESRDLSLWSDLNLSNQTDGTPVTLGNGTEFVTVRGTIPVPGENSEPRGFLRVQVKKLP